jgi:hypothetical protein
MTIMRWAACFGGEADGVWSKKASSGTAVLFAASIELLEIELLELLTRAPGESGSSGRAFAARTSVAGFAGRFVWAVAKGVNATIAAKAIARTRYASCVGEEEP